MQRAQFQHNNDKEGRRDKGVSLCLLTPSVLNTHTHTPKPQAPRSYPAHKHSKIRGTVCNSRSVSDHTNGYKSQTGLTGRARPQHHKDRIERLYYTFISSHPRSLRSSSPSAPWGTRMGCCTFANESRFLFEVFFPFSKHGKRERVGRASERERGAPAIALFFSAVFNPEEDKLCRTQRGSAIGLSGFTRSHSAFLQPSHTTHTHACCRSLTHMHRKGPRY